MSYIFEAELRTDLGKGASRRLRREDKVPAIVYGADKEPVSIAVEHNKIIEAQADEGFYTHILTLNIAGEKTEVLVKDMQRHPYKPKVTHIDFLRVDASHKVVTKIPLHFVGEDIATKKGGVIAHQTTEVEISCLPKDLPEFIEVNAAVLEVGDTLHLSNLAVPKGVVLVELAKGESHDQAVVSLNAPKGAASEDSAEEAAAE
ncbi:MAG: 50S ribosomal protein L25/general stress protein Ctc [Pseudomonadota bacterium]|uniref:50S ribosomal protein L25/general stress protein Ctc n=1 Tax=Gallaecimonas pentaromativorans TaxID=584787 RepID=UPI00067E90BC|nr:50S ribosomal protein L25/general stress protein Ctc [Gallaecimonas pentaromativorans]MED5525145.1 50S ribosomal protein L25/general stress protein Ctc [Pseudomonadota bacterium]